MIQLSCDLGYSPRGDNSVTCEKDTLYSFNKQPACLYLGGCYSCIFQFRVSTRVIKDTINLLIYFIEFIYVKIGSFVF